MAVDLMSSRARPSVAHPLQGTTHRPPSAEAGEKGGMASLSRGLRILEAIAAAAPEGLTPASLAHQLGVKRSTLYRYLAALTEMGYVSQEEDTARYVLGGRAVGLATLEVREQAFSAVSQRFVEEMAKLAGGAAHATVFRRGFVMTVAMSSNTPQLGTVISPGLRRPAHCSASGKVFLAQQPQASLEAYLERPLNAHTESSIVDADVLRQTIAEVREQGYATDVNEYIDGVNCAAVPVYDYTGEVVGALSVSFPVREFSPAVLPRVVHMLQRGAQGMGWQLGYRP